MTYRELVTEAYNHTFEKELISEIIDVAHFVEFKEDDVIMDIGMYIKAVPLILCGTIKVMRRDFDIGELLLYFIEKGNTCAMTLGCSTGNKKSEIRAIAETDGIVAMIPIQKMEEWSGKYRSWRAFVFESYNNRFEELLSAIDNIAFMNMNERLYNYLTERSKIENSKIINKTHLEIAGELNSSRVVISRLLKNFEKEQKIKLNRNSIELL
ncbi:Crp/Fnr family transcriptional regulator [Capnocytophaga stomatis]|uniref:Crp/Fnr family transcriptional regulator n=1 Tax=Capnocytophaga stomatis TaxID=1848904 RepID=A0ABW8QE41_9FLAO